MLVLLEKLLHLETTIFHFSHLLTTEIHVSLRTGSTHAENAKVKMEKMSWPKLFFPINIFYTAIVTVIAIYRMLLY